MPTYKGRITWRVRDENAGERTFHTHAEVTYTDPAELETALDAITTAFDAPLLGRIVGCELTFLDMLGGTIKASPQAGSNIGDGATISFRDSESNHNPYFFPTMAGSKYQGRVLKLDDAEVAAMIQRFLPGNNVSGGASIDFTDEDNRKYVTVPPYAAVKGFRTSRKLPRP